MDQRENRRTKLTKVLLKSSLIELMQKQPINKITVKEICENADINRSTFYVYYGDQYVLLADIEDEIILNTTEYLQKTDCGAGEAEELEAFLTYIAKNVDLFRVLICKQGDYPFQKRLMDIVMERLMEQRKNENKWDEGISEYIFRFVIMGSMSIMQNWINHSLDKSPREVAEIILSLTYKGISAYK